jgi:hypothetical protein
MLGCAVCHYAFIPVDAYNQIHDCYVDNYGGRTPSDSIVAQIYMQLPREFKALAKEWGWNDTAVANGIYNWFKERVVVFLK